MTKAPETVEISGEVIQGMSIRLLLISTHYRKPMDFTMERLAEMEKIYRRWLQRAERSQYEGVPVEFLEVLCDDMNTPRAIALMHGYYKRRENGKLFAAMALLGLIPNMPGKPLMDLDGMKTMPDEHAAMIEGIGVTRQ